MFTGGRKLILIAFFTALLIALVNLVWWVNFQRTEQMLEDQLGRRLAAVAQAAAVSFDTEQVDSLRLGSLDAYLTTISRLESLRQADSLSELFVLDESYYYLATTLLEPDSTYFLADLHGPFLDSVLFGLAPTGITTPTYRSGELYLKSALAPLHGSDGLVAAVLGVEASVVYFDSLSDLRSNLYYASGFSLLGGVILGFLFLLFQRRINRTEERLFLAETHAHLGRMVAVVAHELRNPLMIIRGSAERLKKKTDLDEADYVIEEIDRLNDIVTGYLDFARAGGSLLASDASQQVDLTEFVADIKKHLLEKYHGVEIEWLGEAVASGLKFETYRRSLRQVLLNLLFNAVESCQTAGLPVAVGLNARSSGSRIVLEVVDRGPGLSRAEQKQVFTPFYTTKQSGSGLGLYLSRTIVEQMGGTIALISHPDRGTQVALTLPQTVSKPKM